MFSEKQKAAQPEFWIAADQVVTSGQTGFYAKLEETLESFGFATKVRALCATDMIYKPEAVVDLDTGAIVQAQVHVGDQADHKEMATRVLEAQQNINQAAGEELDTLTVNTVTSDKGYYAVNELQALQ